MKSLIPRPELRFEGYDDVDKKIKAIESQQSDLNLLIPQIENSIKQVYDSFDPDRSGEVLELQRKIQDIEIKRDILEHFRKECAKIRLEYERYR